MSDAKEHVTKDKGDEGACAASSCPITKCIKNIGLGCVIRASAFVIIALHVFEFICDLMYDFDGRPGIADIAEYYISQIFFYPVVLLALARIVDVMSDKYGSCDVSVGQCSSGACSTEKK